MMKEPFGGLILNVAFRMLVPFTIVYGVYVLCLGEFSPGGGFQGGVLMTAVVILMYLGHGYERTTKAVSFGLLHEAEGFASTMYVALAMLGVAVGAQFCQNVLYTVGNQGDLYSSGTIFWMNVTVGIKVITGIGSLSLIMLGVLNSIDVDYKK